MIGLPMISVIVCTLDREILLKKTMSSLLEQSLSPNQYEIIVVDNAFNGAMKEVVVEFQKRSDRIQYFHEPLQGHSRAKNAALKIATGTYVAFIDDDAVANPFWLENILKTFKLNPLAAVVGGKIDPIWQTSRPAWLSDDLLKYLSILDYGDQEKTLGKQKLFGANIAFRKDLLQQAGGFSLRLGRQANNNFLSGEEAWVQERLQRQGHGIVYDPHIQIGHCILRQRLSKDWFENRARWEGYSTAMIDSELARPQKVRLLFSQVFSFISRPVQLFSLLFNLKADAIFPQRIEAKIKISHIKNLLKMW